MVISLTCLLAPTLTVLLTTLLLLLTMLAASSQHVALEVVEVEVRVPVPELPPSLHVLQLRKCYMP